MLDKFTASPSDVFVAGQPVSSEMFCERRTHSREKASQRGFAWTRGLVALAAAVVQLCVSGVAAHAQTLVPGWYQQAPANSPSARGNQVMAYDSAHGQTVLFGGGTASDTWLWNGTTWTQASPVNSPPPRGASAMAYDSTHGQVVMFGGITPGSATARLGDTWLWNGTNWTQANVTGGPSARDGASMVYDPVHGEVVLFGGIDLSGSPLNDTWLWNGTTWTQATPASSPTARFSAGMAYDAATSSVVLFGGSYSGDMADTWVWNGTTWTQQQPQNFPSARDTMGMAYDAALGQVVLFGGIDNGLYLNDTWLWSGTTWTQYTTASSPSQRELNEDMVYDAAHSQVLLFGGLNFNQNPTAFGDTWQFGLPGNFGNVNVCPASATTPAPCSKTISFTYNVTAPVTFSAPQVLTQGTSGLDFQLNSTTCTGFLTGGTCTINVTFAPLAPGSRSGSIQLTGLLDNNSTVVTNTPLYGIGNGPAATIIGNPQTTLNTGSYMFTTPNGTLADAAGNLFISDATQGLVVKIAPGGTTSTVGLGLKAPQQMAEDGAGDLFIADSGLNEIVEVPLGCTTSSCQIAIATNLTSQMGVAIDGAGDLFIGDSNAGEVVESPAGCTTTACQVVVYNRGAGSHPVGIALDAAGDLFVADSGLAQVMEAPAGCLVKGCQVKIGLEWSNPVGVAVDAAGNVYATDLGLEQIDEVPVGCLTVSCEISIIDPLQSQALAIDSAGDLFGADLSDDTVFEFNMSQPQPLDFGTVYLGQTGTGAITLQNIGNQTLQAESPGLLTVSGASYSNTPGSGTPPDCSGTASLAPGATCNVSILFSPQSYTQPNTGTAVFADNALNNLNASQTQPLFGMGAKPVQSFYQVTALVPGTGSGTVTDVSGVLNCIETSGTSSGTCSASLPGSGLVTFTATATGNSTFQGWGGACASFGTNSLCSVVLTQATTITATFDNQNFGSFNVCTFGAAVSPCSTELPVTFVLPTTTTLGAIEVVTQGISGLDFKLVDGNTCKGTLAAGTPCSVLVAFAPLAPGLRTGAVEMFDNNGNMVASQPIYGIGLEPEIAFGPGVETTLPLTGLSYPDGVAVDAAGNTFVADYVAGAVFEYSAAGVQTTVPATGLSAPIGVTVDGAGNVYIVDLSLPYVVKVTPSGVQSTLGTGLGSPLGITLDAVGDVFVGDQDNNRVEEITPSGVQTTVPTTGLNEPWGVAVDAQGDIFIADGGNSRVIEVTAGGVQTTVPILGLSQPYGVAVDAAGDVYVADPVNTRVVEVSANGGPQFTVGSGLNYPSGVFVDGAGSLIIGDQGAGEVFKVNRFTPPAIDFATTNVGSTSADSPVSFTIQNIGNQPLTGSLAVNAAGGSFVQTASSVCSTAFPLAPGARCGEAFAFIPQSATFFSGSAVFTTNNLNSFPLGAVTIPLYGIGATAGVAGTVAVPNVVGLAQAAASSPIATVGLAMGTVTTETSSSVAAGSIISQSPAAGTQVAVGSTVNLLISTGIAQPPSPNPLSFENNYFLTGDYVSAGVTMRGTGVGGIATGNISIPNYTQSATLGVPDGADIVDAFLYWETVESTPSASSNNGTFNGYPIVGQQIGNDVPNFTDGSFTGTIRSYRANVNLYLPVATNGIRYASGTYKITLPDAGSTGLPLTEGASLVFVYRVLSPNFPLKSVVIYDGAGMPTAAATQLVQGFYDAVGGANGTGKNTNIFATPGSWNNSINSVTLGQSNQYSAPLNPAGAYAAVILSTPVNNSDNDGILDAWKAGPTSAADFHVGQPGYYDVKTSTWVGLPGAKHGQKDLFVQLDYMCGAILSSGSCDPGQENLFPSPDANGVDPLALVQQAFAASGVQLHLQIGNAVPEDTCTDNLTTSPAQLCQFPNQPGVIGWKNSLEFSKLYPRNLAACLTGGDCTTRFPYGQKDSYHYVLFGHSLAIPAYNSRFGTLTSINVANGTTTIGTADRGTGTGTCPSRITISGVLGDPSLNGVYNTTGCPDSKTISVATPGVPNYIYPNNTLAEPVIGITFGQTTSISGYSDLGGADSAVTLGQWLTYPNQDMSKRANVIAGTLFHEIGHTLGLSHGGLYYDSVSTGSYVPTFEANCKPNYQSIMNYLFQLDGVGPNEAIAFSNQTLLTLNESTAGSITQLNDPSTVPATVASFATSAWYVPYTPGSPVTPATRHCDGSPLTGDSIYRVDAPISPITPPWTNGQDINGIGTLQTKERGFNDLNNIDLRQVGATGGEFASLAGQLSFGNSVSPLNISAGGTVTLGSGGTVSLGSGGTATLGSGGNATLGSGGTITLGSGGSVTLGNGGTFTLGSAGTITAGSSGTVTLGSGGTFTLGSAGTLTLGSGGTVTVGTGSVTLGSGGTITLASSGQVVTIGSGGGSYNILDANGGTITLGSGGTMTLGSGRTATLGSGGTLTLGSGGTMTLGSGKTATLGSGGTITLGSGGTLALGSGGNVTLGSGGTITLGSGGTLTLGSGGTLTLGSGGTVTLGSGGNLALGSGGNVTLGSGGTATLGSGGTITLGSGGTVTLGSGGNLTLGSGGTITLGSGGTATLGSGGNLTLGSGGTIALGSGGTLTLGSGGMVTLSSAGTISQGGIVTIVPPAGGTYTLGSGGTITLGSGGSVLLASGGNLTLGSGGTITLGSGGTLTLGSGGNLTLGSGGTITLGSGGTITLGSGGNVTLGSGGVVSLGTGGSVNLGTGSDLSLGSVSSITPGSGGPTSTELTYETANSVVRVPTAPTETVTPLGVRVTWKAPAFGVVQTYTIYRSSDGATPIVIGSVSGIGGNPPATEFTDTNPDNNAKIVVYTITTTLVPDTVGAAPRSSQPSAPAVLKNDQTITLGPLPSSVLITSPPTVTATALSAGVPNGLLVAFSTTGSCTVGSPLMVSGVSSATVALTGTGSCTVIASQSGNSSFNAANSVSGTFIVLPQGSTTKSQTITFAQLPNVLYGSTFSLSASSSSGLPVSFTASGNCKTNGTISAVGICSIIASAPPSSTYSAASLTQSFTVYPAVLKVTANSFTVTNAQSIPPLTFGYTGFVNGETSAVITGMPALSTTATVTSSAGSYPITVSTGSLAATNYSFLYVNGTLTIQPANQAALILNAASPLTYGQSETLSVTGGSTGGAVTYNLTPASSCTIAGARLTATSGTGSCMVTATMAGNNNYNPVSSAPATVTLARASQAITFTTSPPANAAYNTSFPVAATGGASGNAVIFTYAGACSNSGATYTMTSSTGTCSVIANQAGNTNYAAAPQVTKTVNATGPFITVSSPSINFGTVYLGSISAQTITVRNTGTAAATITDPILSIVKGGNSNEFVALSLCPRSLAAGNSCTVLIGFIAGPYYTPQTATLQIMDNAPGNPQTVALSALVINPQASLSSTSLNFGTVKHATSSTLNVTLSNPGATPLTFTGVNISGTNAGYFTQTNTCGTSLAAGASCTIAVKFTPAVTGTFSANLTLVDNAQSCGGGSQTVALSGKGN